MKISIFIEDVLRNSVFFWDNREAQKGILYKKEYYIKMNESFLSPILYHIIYGLGRGFQIIRCLMKLCILFPAFCFPFKNSIWTGLCFINPCVLLSNRVNFGILFFFFILFFFQFYSPPPSSQCEWRDLFEWVVAGIVGRRVQILVAGGGGCIDICMYSDRDKSWPICSVISQENRSKLNPVAVFPIWYWIYIIICCISIDRICD